MQQKYLFYVCLFFTEEEPSTPAQPSFIFSPPLTRSRGRRSARKTVNAETAPPKPPSLNQTVETVLTFPSPSPLPREGVSLLESSGSRVGRSGRKGRQPRAAANASMTQIKDRPASLLSRETRWVWHCWFDTCKCWVFSSGVICFNCPFLTYQGPIS